jgi:hypothetical protein
MPITVPVVVPVVVVGLGFIGHGKPSTTTTTLHRSDWGRAAGVERRPPIQTGGRRRSEGGFETHAYSAELGACIRRGKVSISAKGGAT